MNSNSVFFFNDRIYNVALKYNIQIAKCFEIVTVKFIIYAQLVMHHGMAFVKLVILHGMLSI